MAALNQMPNRIKKATQLLNIEGLECNEIRLKNINSFIAPYLCEVCIRKSIVKNEIEFEQMFKELKRYLYICSLNNCSVAMLNSKIDDIWHQFILFTRYYEDFCKEFLGKFIHHCPNTTFTPSKKESAISFVENYSTLFGEISSIWELPENNHFITYKDGVRLAGDTCVYCTYDDGDGGDAG